MAHNTSPCVFFFKKVTKAKNEKEIIAQHGDTRFNVKNPLQQREVKTTDANQQNFTILGVCL
jgi:hypothetical protein